MSKLFESIVDGNLSLQITLLVILFSIVLGFIISVLYIVTSKNKGYSQNFSVTLIILPIVIAVIILLVENSIARAFSLAGAFALIRFRSAPGDPKDIAFVFFTLAVGLACGIGYVGYATVFSIILSITILILHFTNFGKEKDTFLTLKISVPENLNFQSLFDDILNEYTVSWETRKVKTTDFGAIFVIEYAIRVKKGINQKQFIDDLRCRNGNLNISLVTRAESESFI